MPDIVNEDDLSALAAEYVIGTLDPDERTRANVLYDVDQGFRDLVRVWERQLGELHLMVEPVAPDGRIWERIRSKLGLVLLPPAPMLPPVAEPKLELVSEHGPDLEAEERESERAPEREPPTPEQQLAELVREAERFSEQRVAELAAESRAEAPAPVDEMPAEARAEALLAEAAQAIARPPAPGGAEPVDEPVEEAHAAELEIEPAALGEPTPVETEPPPARETFSEAGALLAPVELQSDVVHDTEREWQGGAGWRAAALFMTLLAFGLGGLIAAWRLVPDRLPLSLQPAAVFGLTKVSAPPERKTAPHGTQFEE